MTAAESQKPMRRRIAGPAARLLLAVASVFTISQPAGMSPLALAHPRASGSPTAFVAIPASVTQGIPLAPAARDPAPGIAAASAVVIDLRTGTAVYAKRPNAPEYPASITKIMTALIALQRGRLTDQLRATALAEQAPPDKLYLVPGEYEPLSKLLYGLMLYSANDAAVVIAQHYGGSVAGFARLMNAEARRLGARHTHFVNPNGLPNPRHVTTAYDMALIAQAALRNPEFRRIVGTRTYDWKGARWQAHLVNLNRMLFAYPGTFGVKTGFTNEARHTLVVAARHGDQSFLAVLMKEPTAAEMYQDASRLLNWAFANYRTQQLAPAGWPVARLDVYGKPVTVTTACPVLATLPREPVPNVHWSYRGTAPQQSVPAGSPAGRAICWVNGQAGLVPVRFAQPVVIPSRGGYWWAVFVCAGSIIGVLGWQTARRRRISRRWATARFPGRW